MSTSFQIDYFMKDDVVEDEKGNLYLVVNQNRGTVHVVNERGERMKGNAAGLKRTDREFKYTEDALTGPGWNEIHPGTVVTVLCPPSNRAWNYKPEQKFVCTDIARDGRVKVAPLGGASKNGVWKLALNHLEIDQDFTVHMEV